MSEDNFPSAVLGLFGTALETAVHETKMELSNASTLSKQNKAMQCPIAGIFFGKLAVRKSVSPDRVATLWVKVKSNGVMSSQPNTNLHNSDQLSVFYLPNDHKGYEAVFHIEVSSGNECKPNFSVHYKYILHRHPYMHA